MYPVKFGQFFLKKPLVFSKNRVTCLNKHGFHKHPIKVGQFLCKITGLKNEIVILRVGKREREATNTQTY